MPVLFTVDGGIINLKASTYLPNMINMVVVKNSGGQRKLIVPNPCFEPFLQAFSTSLSMIGYQTGEVVTADTLDLHSGGGEAHCVTNLQRSGL